MEELEMKLGRQVQDKELADHMGIPVGELHKLLGQVHSFFYYISRRANP